ncbi:SMI1/KNR4 family protein [Oceanivirga salmonicida]|uniref:SMI1/KNR4 family protein n=1 Tax=Oceanivirga salmonicida TaxID=1769291 RepID=UPI000832A0F4|nr:SMI1/KNR4 family protein [Oceanivirga salmonicida]
MTLKEELIKKNIKLLDGLTDEEIEKVELLYNIKFPLPYKKLLKEFQVYYDEKDRIDNNPIIWNDFSENNVMKLIRAIEDANAFRAEWLSLYSGKANWPDFEGMPENIIDAEYFIEEYLLNVAKLISIDYCGNTVITEENEQEIYINKCLLYN